ncbi:MAG: cytochrome c oxidase subunit II [Crocinitomicaceae bacterium]|nr:cytochrome c oxidase subunit II [Crocinitomicaceae bacterium]
MVTKLVILLVIVLGVVALAQLMRVYELSSKLDKKSESDISNRDNRLNAKLMLLFMIATFIGFIWLMLKYGWTGRGVAASVHGKELDWLLNLNFIIIIAVFFITNALLFWFAYKYVKKPGVPAYFLSHNNKLEMIWTIVPAVVLSIIIILGLKSWNEVTDDAAPEAIRVELFSKQFDWTARYSGTDNTLGRFDYKLTTANNELALLTTNTIDSAIRNMETGVAGIEVLENKLNDPKLIMSSQDREKMMTDLSRKERLIRLLYQMKARHDSKLDAQAWDDIIQKDTLYLCQGKEYEFNFRSKDVLHSAYFPHFRAQMNTVPGMTTRFKFIPDLTTEEMRELKKNKDFNFILLCNKICGGAHYKMKMIVVVLEEKKYDAWMKSKANQTFRDIYFPKAKAPEENKEEENEEAGMDEAPSHD